MGCLGADMRKIAIRIDDVVAEMDWVKFHRFEKLLDKYEICPLIGVVPMNGDHKLEGAKGTRNEAFADEENYKNWLKEKQKLGWVIAMHGTYHVYLTKQGGLFPLNDFSEFAGVSYENQKHKLEAGVGALEEIGIRTDIFMAPGHSFDKDTLKALKECGFHYITDGFGDMPYVREGLTFLPISFLRKKELRKESGVTTFVIHTWDMTEAEFRWYEDLFENKRDRFINYRDLMKRPAKERSARDNMREYMMAAGKRLVAGIG